MYSEYFILNFNGQKFNLPITPCSSPVRKRVADMSQSGNQT